MKYIQLTTENINQAHLCCAISEKKGEHRTTDKKAWLKKRIAEGLVFYKADVRGKAFIEYLDGEKAWIPIQAEHCLFINCLWVAGKYKGTGISNALLNHCIEDAKQRNKKGICILSSRKKMSFLADPNYLTYKGFQCVDEITPFQLYYLPLNTKDAAATPKFQDSARTLHCEEDGFVLYYTCQCPHAAHYAAIAKEIVEKAGWRAHLHLIESQEEAIQVPAPVTTYALFINHQFITNEILSEKKLTALLQSYES